MSIKITNETTHPREATSAMESVIFTNISENLVGKTAVSSLSKIINFLGAEYSLKPSRVKNSKVIMGKLKRMVIEN